jgi:glycosyltransferase involved in cell wall biosynthesis
LLCVAALAPHKGQDVLVAALAEVADLAWRCRLVGPLDRDPAFVAQLRAATAAAGLADRVEFVGPLTRADLDRAYAVTDLVVLPSLGETYGMVVAEALAHAVPVLVSDVGGVREALGDAGLLVPAGDPRALAAALRRWLTEPDLRVAQRVAAATRRATLPGWPDTVTRVAAALVAAATPVG